MRGRVSVEHWTVFSLAFAAVVVHAWLCRREDPHWYLGCIVPLLYGGAVAGMFLGDDLLLALRIILFGAVLPVAGLLFSISSLVGNAYNPFLYYQF